VAEKVDVKGWSRASRLTGRYRHVGRGHLPRARRPTGLGKTVEVYAKRPGHASRAVQFFSAGDVVVVELAAPGHAQGPCRRDGDPSGNGQTDGCSMLRCLPLVNGKIKSFNCYPSGT